MTRDWAQPGAGPDGAGADRALRILYVTNGFPWPLTSGYLRHYFLIRELAARHEIVLCSLVGPDHRPADEAPLAPLTAAIHAVPAARGARSLPAKATGRLRALLGRGDAAALRLGSVAADVARGWRPDVVVFSGKRTYPVLRLVAADDDLPVVADLCDATSLRVRGALRHARWRRRPLLWLELAEVRRIERRLVRGADALLFASARDRDALVNEPDERRRSTVIANGVDLETWTRSAQRLGAELVFTGAMDYPPNVDAAVHLARVIFPAVRAARPGTRLLLVGRDPTPAVVALGDDPGVTVTGFVDDVRPYLDRAAVFVAPLRFGAGIQNKVLEALAMEVPVVATSLAAAGLRVDGAPPPPLVVADDDGTVVARVVELLDRAAADGLPHREGRAFVEAHFGWAAAGARLEEVVAAAAAGRRAASGPGGGRRRW